MFLNVSRLKSLYTQASPFVRGAFALLPPPHRFSAEYYKWRRVIRRADADSIYANNFAAERLRRVLRRAVAGVPRYQSLASSDLDDLIGRDPFAALKEFPVTNRAELSEQPDAFVHAGVPSRGYHLATTGGTSGRPVSLRLSNASWGAEWAFVFDYLERFGVGDTHRRLSLRGVRFASNETAIESNPTYRELRVSPFHLSARYRSEVVDAVTRFSPQYIHGYPTAVSSFLALLGADAAEILKDVRCVLCVSEDLSAEVDERIRTVLGVPPASFYGLSERIAFMPYDPETRVWRPSHMYGVTEILEDRIVGTGFINDAMTIVRYDTGDRVELDAAGNIVSVGGRWKHATLVSRSGGRVSMTALNLHTPDFASIGEFQIIQFQPGEAELRYLHHAGVGAGEAAARIAAAFTAKCSGEIAFKAVPNNEFVLTKVGKRPLVVPIPQSR